MNLTEHKIWQLPIILLLALWLGGCSSHSDVYYPSAPAEEDELLLYLQIFSGKDLFEKTRAVNGFEDPVLASEKIQSMRVIIVDRNSGVIVHNYFERMIQPDSFIGDLGFEVQFGTPYRIYLIANETGIPGYQDIIYSPKLAVSETYTDGYLENSVIQSASSALPLIDNSRDVFAPVPMTEMYDITTMERPANLTSDSQLSQRELFFITRAASKFSFYFYKSADLNELEGLVQGNVVYDNMKIKISGLSRAEYLFPHDAVYSPAKYNADGTVNSTDAGGDPIVNRVITGFSVPASANPGQSYIFSPPSFSLTDIPVRPAAFDSEDYSALATATPYSPHLYFPEGKNAGGFTCSISADGEADDDFAEAITLPNLDSLPRNTHVKVIITILQHEIKAEAVVEDYTEVVLDPGFGVPDTEEEEEETPEAPAQ